MRKWQKLIEDRRGATAIEYGLLIALIGVSLIAAMSNLNAGFTKTFGAAGNAMSR